MQIIGSSIAIENLSLIFGQTWAVDGVSLCVNSGDKVSITGANGAGKSSVLRCILGLQTAWTGTIEVNGGMAHSERDWNIRRREIAYVPQRPPSGRFPLSVRELLQSGGGNFEPRAEQLGVAELLNRSVSTLSGGQLQRCFIARALTQVDHGATALIADEPTSALDFQGQEAVADILTSISATLVVVTHDEELVSRCNKSFEMAGGLIRNAGDSGLEARA